MLNAGIMVILTALSWIDVKRREFPGRLMWTMTAVAWLYAIFTRKADMWELFGTALFGGGILCAGRLTNYGIGAADGLLAGILCLILGLRTGILLMWLSMILCGIYGMILILLRKAGRKTKLPLVPFMAVAQAALWSMGAM